MYLSIFAAETKTCQSPVGLPDRALELLTCPSNLTVGRGTVPVLQALASPAAPAVPAQAAMGGFPPSRPHPLASELRPAFLSFCAVPNRPTPIGPSMGCLPTPITRLLSTHFPAISSQTQEIAATNPQFLVQMWCWLNNPDHIFFWHIIFSFAFIWPWL